MKTVFLIISSLLMMAPSEKAVNQKGEEMFLKATEAYNAGDFKQAISLYEEIIKGNQHSASLYFNLGNSHYKLGEIAPSIYYYEKALILSPADSEILNNLGFAQNMTLDAIQSLPETDLSRFYHQWVYSLNLDGWAYAGVVFMVLFVAGFILFKISIRPNKKRLAFIGSFLALFLSILSSFFAYLQYRDYKSDQPAIVFSEEVIVRSEPNNAAPEAFRLHEGTKVQLEEELNDWQKVRLEDGQLGWLPSNSIRVIKDF